MPIFDPAAVKSIARDDAAFKLSLRFLTGSVRFNIGETNYLLTFADGAFGDFGEDDGATKADVVFSGSTEAWDRMLSPEFTPPGHQNPLYSDGRSGVHFEGDVLESVGPFARAINEFYRILRRVASGRELDNVLPRVERDFDETVGRYMYLRLQGVQYRIFYEEAGHGDIPLLIQHTAGADARQARFMLEDPDFQKHFRMIAYDVPFHGKSMPPTSHKWWEEQFALTKELLLDLVFGICDKLELDRPVFVGSAMGGMLALDIAYHEPERFRAVIGLNAGPPVSFPDSALDMIGTFSSPHVNNHWLSTMMMANMSGSAPGIYRRELGWVYSQCGPGISGGALNYYLHDHDLTPEQAAEIDTDKVAVYLFSGADDAMSIEGEYGTSQLASKMVGTPYKVLPKLGHFGAAENPDAFKADLWPALDEIIARRA